MTSFFPWGLVPFLFWAFFAGGTVALWVCLALLIRRSVRASAMCVSCGERPATTGRVPAGAVFCDECWRALSEETASGAV